MIIALNGTLRIIKGKNTIECHHLIHPFQKRKSLTKSGIKKKAQRARSLCNHMDNSPRHDTEFKKKASCRPTHQHIRYETIYDIYTPTCKAILYCLWVNRKVYAKV